METVASQLWPMPALFVLSFPHLVPLRTPPVRGPFVRCPVLPVPSHSPVPPRAPNPEQSRRWEAPESLNHRPKSGKIIAPRGLDRSPL